MSRGSYNTKVTGGKVQRWGAVFLLLPIALCFTYPFLWMLLGGFKSNPEITRPMQLWPERFDIDYYGQLFGGAWIPFFRVFANSVAISLAQATGAVTLSALAGYAFAKHAFVGQRLFFMLALTVIVAPRQALALPLFTWLNTLGLVDSLFGVILPGMVSGLGVIYFTQVFRRLPEEYLQAARTCGAPEWRVFLTMLPLVWPALLSYGMIHSIMAWHEHLMPLLVLTGKTSQTLPLALTGLYGSSMRFPYAVMMAGSTVSLLPTAILFAVLHRKFKSSLSDVLVH